MSRKTDRIVFTSLDDFFRLSELQTENSGSKTCSTCRDLDKGLQMQTDRIGTLNVCTRLALREPGRKKAIPFVPETQFSCKFWRTKDEK